MLTGGTIAAIVIGAVVFCLLAGICIYGICDPRPKTWGYYRYGAPDTTDTQYWTRAPSLRPVVDFDK